MAIIAKGNNNEGFELIEAGVHLGLCYGVIDLGTQKVTFQNEIKLQRKVRILFELPNLKKEFKAGEGEKPFSISKEYTLSLDAKANLYKDLVSWRGKQFTEEELEGFDISKLLGKPCQIQIIHKQGKNGDYAAIQSITPIMKGTDYPKQTVNAQVEFSVDEFSKSKFESLPEYLRKKIEESIEYKEGILKEKYSPSENQTEDAPIF